MNRRRFRLNAVQNLVVSFACLILVGALLLMLPISSRDGRVCPFWTLCLPQPLRPA